MEKLDLSELLPSQLDRAVPSSEDLPIGDLNQALKDCMSALTQTFTCPQEDNLNKRQVQTTPRGFGPTVQEPSIRAPKASTKRLLEHVMRLNADFSKLADVKMERGNNQKEFARPENDMSKTLSPNSNGKEEKEERTAMAVDNQPQSVQPVITPASNPILDTKAEESQSAEPVITPPPNPISDTKAEEAEFVEYGHESPSQKAAEYLIEVNISNCNNFTSPLTYKRCKLPEHENRTNSVMKARKQIKINISNSCGFKVPVKFDSIIQGPMSNMAAAEVTEKEEQPPTAIQENVKNGQTNAGVLTTARNWRRWIKLSVYIGTDLLLFFYLTLTMWNYFTAKETPICEKFVEYIQSNPLDILLMIVLLVPIISIIKTIRCM